MKRFRTLALLVVCALGLSGLSVQAEPGEVTDRPVPGSRDRDLHPGMILLAPTGMNSVGTTVPVKPAISPATLPAVTSPAKAPAQQTASASPKPARKSFSTVTAIALPKRPKPVKAPVVAKKKAPAVTPPEEGAPIDIAASSEYLPAAAYWPTSSSDGPVFKASLDKAGQMPVYKVGDKLVINITAQTDCNVIVFDHAPTGVLTQIYPNDFDKTSLVRAGQKVSIGGEESSFDYNIVGDGGIERIFVYAYPTSTVKSPLTLAMAAVPNTPFRSTSMSLEEYRKLVNSSMAFHSRGVKIIGKSGPQSGPKPVAFSPTTPASNKLELTFKVVTK